MPVSMDRRAVLAGGLALLAGSALPLPAATASGFFARRGIPIGLQLYTMAESARTALEATLARIASLGYETLELAGLHGHGAAQLRATADRAGLKLLSTHVSADARPGELALEGDLHSTAAQLHVLGVTDVVMPMFSIPTRLGAPAAGEGFLAYLQRIATQLTADDWQRTAEQLNRYGRALQREGLRFGYHNHNPEFAPLPGDRTGFEILLGATDPALVHFELDTGWAAAAGHDPGQLIRSHSRRITQLHVKDIRATTRTNFALSQDPTEVGSGKLDWPALLAAADAAGIRRYFVEQEPPFPGDRFDSIARSLRYLKSLPG